MKKQIFYIFLFIFQVAFSQNQPENLYEYFSSIKSLEFDKISKLIKSKKNSKTNELYILLYKIIEDDRQTNLSLLFGKRLCGE